MTIGTAEEVTALKELEIAHTCEKWKLEFIKAATSDSSPIPRLSRDDNSN